MVKLSELVFDRNDFPLRLIDLRSTLASSGGVCFHLPSDWNFHVVSHTWSQDIRDLSVAVCRVLLEGGWSTDQDLYARGLSYNEAFAKPRFAKNSSYEKLMEFFRVLVADGASRVWFDALCINQKDDDEKAHEIRRMGAYYRLSTGCYVITHGIGSELGFKAATTKTLEPVPRWFTRAWTIQESILPEKLSFIVEKFDGTSIKQFYSEQQFLSILSEQWRDWDEPLEPIKWEKGKKMGDVSRRRAYNELYCLGTDAYRRMMQIALHPAWHWSEFVKAFGELADADFHDHDIDVESVVKIVQQRHCSVEEDRVLSIIGLLGIGGEHQLRTKQTLDQQLVWLAMTLMKENPKLLINLCAADLEGYAKPCISWLPDLRYAEHRRFWNAGQVQYKHFTVDRHAARVKDVRDNGKIVLSARTLRGNLVRESLGGFCLQFGERRVEFRGDYWPQPCLLSLEKMGPLAPDSTHRLCGGLSIPAHGIDEFRHLSTYHSFSICEITLLMLGCCHPCDFPHTLAMACVGTNEEMQKVGILGFTPHEDLDFSSSFEDCLIGGFGDDLTCFLSEECQPFLPRVLSSPSEKTLKQQSADILSQHFEEFGDDLTCFLNEECQPFLPRVLSSPSENTLSQQSAETLSQHSEEDLEVLPVKHEKRHPFLRFFRLTWQVALALFVLVMVLGISFSWYYYINH